MAHGCIIHGCTIGKGSLIAMGAIILSGVMVGDNCIVGAGTLVPEGGKVPSGSLALGIPARVIRSVKKEDLVRISETREAYQKLMKQYQK